MQGKVVQFILILVFVEITIAAIFNSSLKEIKTNDIDDLVAFPKSKTKNVRRMYPRNTQSTSSSKEKTKKGSAEDSKESLSDSMSASSTDSEDRDRKGKKKKDRKPKSSHERTGWRKWHRKCHPCPEDMRKKWRDPSINWICGAYQRARRSFKSLCMMHYRNCQDGTMFTKVGDHRCPNSTGDTYPHGDHFFYDYKAQLSDDSTDSKASTDSSESSSTSWDTSREIKAMEAREKREQERLKKSPKEASD